MSAQDPFDSGQGYTVLRDKPKTNGSGPGRQDNETTGETSKTKDSSEDDQKGQDEREQRRQQRRGLQLLPPPSSPMQVAREFVQQRCLYNDVPDALMLRYWRGG